MGAQTEREADPAAAEKYRGHHLDDQQDDPMVGEEQLPRLSRAGQAQDSRTQGPTERVQMTARAERLLANLGFTWNDCMEAWEWVQPSLPIILIRPSKDDRGHMLYTVHTMAWLHGWDDHGSFSSITPVLSCVQELMTCAEV